MNRLAIAAVAVSTLGSVASAATIDFTYEGSSFGLYYGTGVGSITYTGSGSSFSDLDVTAFSFTTSRNSTFGFVSTFTYTMADLMFLSGTVDGNGVVTSLMVECGGVEPVSNAPAAWEALSIQYDVGTGTNSAELYHWSDDLRSVALAGPITFAAVPAPGALGVLAGVGLLGARRRR